MNIEKLKIKQLKELCTQYKLKRSGRKQDLISRIHDYKQRNSSSIKIQSLFRGYITRKYFQYKGNIKSFHNSEDILTFDSWDDINYHQIISYMDDDGFRYAFDIKTLYCLFEKGENPYTRKRFPNDLQTHAKAMVRIGRHILKYNIITHDKHKYTNLSKKQRIDNIFIHINQFGYANDTRWFTHLQKFQLIDLYRFLHDIFHYRAQLSQQIKRNIVQPHGNPFIDFPSRELYLLTQREIQLHMIKCIELLLYNSIDNAHKQLGVMYFLTALTLVSREARNHLPFLYESVR